MPRRLKYDIPGPDWRVRPDEISADGLAKLFAPDLAPPLRLVVDLGFGRGEFLQELAAADPATAFLGVEYSMKRVLKLARRLARGPLRNVRLVEATAEEIVRERLPQSSVAVFWINFPDPWPKKRHHGRRLVQPRFARELALRLEPGGELHVTTDHVEYAEQIDAVLAGEPLLENLFAPEPHRREALDRPATAYQLEWRAEGRPLHFFRYARRGAAPAEDG